MIEKTTVLYAWELGWGLGHYSRFGDIAEHLSNQGIRIAAALRNVKEASACKTDLIFQAPYSEDINPKDPTLSCGDILLHFGFSEYQSLLESVKKWRAIISGAGTSLVVADYAPTAILAAKTMKVPVLLLSSGFDTPPKTSPLPNLRPWANCPGEWLSDIERRALLSINSVLHHFGSQQLFRNVHELFDVEESALATIPEIDHFYRPSGANYWGVLQSKAEGSVPEWPEAKGARVFSYVSSSNPYFGRILDCLATSRQPTIVFSPDPGIASIPHPATMRIYSSPLNLQLVADQADLAVTHAGVTTTSTFIAHGKPTLMFPETLEQLLFAGRVKFSGAGDLVPPQQEAPDIEGVFHRMLGTDRYAIAAKALAEKYKHLPREVVSRNIAARIIQLISK